jgi:hypothetical protein
VERWLELDAFGRALIDRREDHHLAVEKCYRRRRVGATLPMLSFTITLGSGRPHRSVTVPLTLH